MQIPSYTLSIYHTPYKYLSSTFIVWLITGCVWHEPVQTDHICFIYVYFNTNCTSDMDYDQN